MSKELDVKKKLDIIMDLTPMQKKFVDYLVTFQGRTTKTKAALLIIVDNMSAIAQSAISFGTFPPSYPTFARDRDRNVSVSPVSSFVVLL